MRALLLSAVLYLIGVSIVLLLRPTLMFRADGSWKEFGTRSPNHTILPFWLFCLLWALGSYAIALLVSGETGSAAVSGPIATSATAAAAALQPIEPPEDLVPVLPTNRNSKSNNIQTPYGAMKPGYYVLDQRAVRKNGIPKYIYVGEGPPDDGDASEAEE